MKIDLKGLVNVDVKTRTILRLICDCRLISTVTVTPPLVQGNSSFIHRKALLFRNLSKFFLCRRESPRRNHHRRYSPSKERSPKRRDSRYGPNDSRFGQIMSPTASNHSQSSKNDLREDLR